MGFLGFSQDLPELKWWNPMTDSVKVLEGQGWDKSYVDGYGRLPKTAETKVRKPVWDLSMQSAGLSINFVSNSSTIAIKYKVKGTHAFPHMSATGVSGVDLYAKTSDGKWVWNRGKYYFRDIITYNYTQLPVTEGYHDKGRQYKLYLPSYNEIEWLEIGVEQQAVFNVLPIRKEKPIVVYGTSIAQGACASRPGMAWASILERALDRPVINLGFSGNGRLEKEVLDYIETINAKLYVLDCLPNLTPTDDMTLENVYERIIAAVKQLKGKQPSIPILLVEHSGYSDGETNKERLKVYSELNQTLQKAYQQLISEGIEDIHILTREGLNLGLDSYVDGTHPTDLGMLQYAQAYETSIRGIINESLGNISTTIPVTQNRSVDYYDWSARHKYIVESNAKNPPKICFIGNSIVHQWGGASERPLVNNTDSWKTYFESIGVKNLGFGWDRIENVLWHIYHGTLDGFDAEQIIMKMGTNNLQFNSDIEIVEGIRFLVKQIKQRQPKAKITLIGILPRRDFEPRIKGINEMIFKMTEEIDVNYLSIGNVFLTDDGTIDESLFRDGLHPNAKGYDKIGPLINAHLQE